jgi:DNA mismatch repair protein MutL
MTIRKLPQDIASKIAAGEVVERPLSVVKELMENSVDAGATEIDIQIKGAGSRMIQVEDNGIGIPSAQAALALQRYATSKISTIEDLDGIRSLGFRGEALASVAAVSRMTLISKSGEEDTGIRLNVESGKIIDQQAAGLSTGTRIVIEDLFFNVPARRKFLKSERTERRIINELVSRYALFYADKRFKLTLEDRVVLSTNGNGERREVLSQIYDVETAKAMLDLKVVDEYLSLEGFISPTSISRSNRKEIFFFINGRLISDTALSAAVTRAYQNMLMVGRYPITAIFMTIDPQQVDVNVHPTKAEVRFQEPSRIFGLIHSAVRKTISAFSDAPVISQSIWQGAGGGQPREIDPAWTFSANFTPAPAGEMTSEEAPDAVGTTAVSAGEPAGPKLVHIPLLRLVGQIGRTYLVAEGPDGLYLIDQHAAHERVLFERFLKNPDSNDSQYLLEPVIVQVPGKIEADLAEQIKQLNKLGFKIEDFGPSTYKIVAIPVVISKMDPKEAFISAIEEDAEDSSLLENAKENKMVTRICKRAAVKGGQVLSVVEQEQLVRDLEACESPRTCPHGRPTMIHLSVDMLERQFGRRGAR